MKRTKLARHLLLLGDVPRASHLFMPGDPLTSLRPDRVAVPQDTAYSKRVKNVPSAK